jgi:hypothetical protein
MPSNFFQVSEELLMFLVPAVPWLLVFGYFEAIVMAQCAHSSPHNTR